MNAQREAREYVTAVLEAGMPDTVTVYGYLPSTPTAPCVGVYPGDDWATEVTLAGRTRVGLEVRAIASGQAGNPFALETLEELTAAAREALNADGGILVGTTRKPTRDDPTQTWSAITPVTITVKEGDTA